MSKSLGNVIRAREFMDKYHPEVLKFLMLTAHYRAMLSLSEDKILQSLAGLSRIYEALAQADDLSTGATGSTSSTKLLGGLEQKMADAEKNMQKALDDDFNTVEVFAALYDVTRAFNALNLGAKKKTAEAVQTASSYASWIRHWGGLMALFQEKPGELLERLNQILITEKGIDVDTVERLIQERGEARAQKNWAESDRLRDQLLGMGIDFKDTPDGTTWRVRV